MVKIIEYSDAARSRTGVLREVEPSSYIVDVISYVDSDFACIGIHLYPDLHRDPIISDTRHWIVTGLVRINAGWKLRYLLRCAAGSIVEPILNEAKDCIASVSLNKLGQPAFTSAAGSDLRLQIT
jgi:hypothetical protein